MVIVREVKDTPPAELLRCPPVPAGLPASGEAVIPPAWRTGIIGIAKAYRQSADQLSRLIQFHTGSACPTHGD
ncbi:hypothetical protein NI454_01100 [Brevundimonas diminuta]|uniref:hypothetical protein n=1 Tax=Brevundimonas diminuta TaxID=293 RepID=UPI002097906A|nr:hypothetical protein [Brevundimonas diminuta]MCO8028541.1 hypothetical protein [Brevundimonas diminuta]